MASKTPNPFDIDANDLDGAWLEMASKTRHFGRAKADAEYAHNRAVAKLKVVAAQLEQRVRRAPASFGLPDKPQVGDINAAVVQHEDYQAASRAVDDAQYALSVASADVFASVDNRKALENLVRLTEIDYRAEREYKPRDPAYRARTDESRRREVRTPEED